MVPGGTTRATMSNRSRNVARAGRPPRSILALLAIGALVALAAASWYGLRGPSPELALVRTDDQNVLLITIDTLRADALGCYGGAAATPAQLSWDAAMRPLHARRSGVRSPPIPTGRLPIPAWAWRSGS